MTQATSFVAEYSKITYEFGSASNLTDMTVIVVQRPRTYDRQRTRGSGWEGGMFFEPPRANHALTTRTVWGVSYQHEQGSCHGYRSISCTTHPSTHVFWCFGPGQTSSTNSHTTVHQSIRVWGQGAESSFRS